jgi:hypothetical protein
MGALQAAPMQHDSLPRVADLGWTEARPLTAENAQRIPETPGLVALYANARLVWAESTENVRACLSEIAVHPVEVEPYVAWWLARGPLAFRLTLVSDANVRRHILRALLHEARLPSRPSAI